MTKQQKYRIGVWTLDVDEQTMYYVKFNQKGIWQRQFGSDSETLLVEGVTPTDALNFFAVDNQMVYLKRLESFDDFILRDLKSATEKELARLPPNTVNAAGILWIPSLNAIQYGATEQYSDIWKMTIKNTQP